jgi:hypothetical protein
VLDLWQRDDGSAPGDRAAARAELQRTSDLIKRWYDDLAAGIDDVRAVRPPLAHDETADGRLVEAVRQHLRDERGHATATAVRMIWTGDHLDAARRLQESLVGPAEAVTEAARLTPLAGIRPFTSAQRRMDALAARPRPGG